MEIQKKVTLSKKSPKAPLWHAAAAGSARATVRACEEILCLAPLSDSRAAMAAMEPHVEHRSTSSRQLRQSTIENKMVVSIAHAGAKYTFSHEKCLV